MSAVEQCMLSPPKNEEICECVKKAQYQSQQIVLDQQILPHQVASRNLFIQDLTENIRVMTLQNKRKFDKVHTDGVSLRKPKQSEQMSTWRRLE